MGCFWQSEEVFREVKGVKETVVGYMGGHTKKPTYEQVCTDKTGHAEVVQIEYDPKEVSYEKLLKIFWENHDPTTMDRQGPDVGSQYRSVIFYHSPEQKELAEESRGKIENAVTEIAAASDFSRAEEYHQKYLQKTGLKVCH